MQILAENRILTGSTYADLYKKQNKIKQIKKNPKTQANKIITQKSSIACLMFVVRCASLFYSIFVLDSAKWCKSKELCEQALEQLMIKDPVHSSSLTHGLVFLEKQSILTWLQGLSCDGNEGHPSYHLKI